MDFFSSVLKPILFKMDPERAHNLGLWAIRKGLVPFRSRCHERPVKKLGLSFTNPVGLAAGFDKNAVAVDQWHKFGFGFAEIGTVTRFAQPGNEQPRLFRFPKEKAIINRMGFNNAGADAVAATLQKSHSQIPLGINIGKSKVTPIEDAAADYCYSFRRLAPFADYVVINVSSPNTPNLRSLQAIDPLRKILDSLKSIDSSKPILVKIAPDLMDQDLEDIAKLVLELELAGIVATNTTISREAVPMYANISGGLSGAPLAHRSDEVISFLRPILGSEKVLIGVGGIMTPEDAQRKLDRGADLIQIYSGWVFAGPRFVFEIVRSLR